MRTLALEEFSTEGDNHTDEDIWSQCGTGG